MARRRMYLFERAYRDFFTRLRSLLIRLRAASGSLWGWFYHGAGAKAWELLLNIAVVAGSMLACGYYIRFERSQGRGFSANMAFVVAFIFVEVFVLLWSWKAPVHFTAKGLSAISAAGTVLVLALAVALAAVAIFIPYLLVLLTLTVLSLVVFLPMRAAHWFWLQRYRITYKCPYDDCPRRRLMPVHVCSCGAEYEDLQPSFYGIFHHVCRHGDKNHKLPTMDFLGRNRLPRLCGGCRRPLLHTSLGQLREWPIFVMGGPNVGKSVFLAQGIREISKVLGSQPGATVCLDSEQQQREHAEQLRSLDRGQVLSKTAGDVMTAYGLAVRIPKGLRALIYFFDKRGEYFEKMRDFGRMRGIEGLNGILLLVDPFSLPALEEHASLMRGEDLSPSPFHNVAANLILAIEQMLPGSQNRQCDVPLGIVLSKADAFPVESHPFLAGLVSRDPGSSAKLCRDAMEKLGASNSVRMLEQKFKHVRYFACSSLGRAPDVRNASPFRAAGVLEPLLWLLSGASPALAQGALPSKRETVSAAETQPRSLRAASPSK